MRFFLFWLTMYLGWIVNVMAVPAPALGKRDEPIEIVADSLEILQESQRAKFSGNVIAKQGAVTLRAASMTVHYRQNDKKTESTGALEQGSVSRIEADGNVTLTTLEESAQGQHGVYNVDEKKVQMSGNVTLTRGKNILKGQQLVYDFTTGRSVLGAGKTKDNSEGTAGAGSGGRIRAVFVPEKKN